MKELLLIVVLLLFPVGIGGLCNPILKKDRAERTLGGTYLTGCLGCGVVFAVLILLGRIRGWQFVKVEKCVLLAGVFMLAACGLALLFFKWYRFDMKQLFISVQKKGIKENVAGAMAYVSVAAVYFTCPFYVSETFSMPEQVFSLVRTGDLTMIKDSFAILYSCLCKWFALSPESVLFRVIPYIVLVLCFCVVSELGTAFFGTESRAKTIFLVCYTLLILFGNEAHMNPPYVLLHYPYEGMTIVSNVLVPFLLVVLLKKENLLWVPVLIFLAVVADPDQKGWLVLVFEVLVFGIYACVYSIWNRRKRK